MVCDAHDEAALVMDGEVEVHLVKPDQPLVAEGKEGSVKLSGRAEGEEDGLGEDSPRAHGAVAQGRGVSVPQHSEPGVVLLQTIKGENTIERWAEICQTKA